MNSYNLFGAPLENFQNPVDAKSHEPLTLCAIHLADRIFIPASAFVVFAEIISNVALESILDLFFALSAAAYYSSSSAVTTPSTNC